VKKIRQVESLSWGFLLNGNFVSLNVDAIAETANLTHDGLSLFLRWRWVFTKLEVPDDPACDFQELAVPAAIVVLIGEGRGRLQVLVGANSPGVLGVIGGEIVLF
jgi:hypothetical protein